MWLLAELDATPLKDLLIFKGGTALKRCYFGDYRFSEDLDFTLGRRVDFPEIRRGLDEVFGKVTTDSGINFAFENQEQAGHTNSYAFYLGYQGPLPKPNSVKVDITIEEVIVLPLEQRPVLRAYDEFIQEKLRFRGRQIAGTEENILAKETRLKALWTTRLGHQIAQLPEFEEVFRAVRRHLRQANFPKDADG